MTTTTTTRKFIEKKQTLQNLFGCNKVFVSRNVSKQLNKQLLAAKHERKCISNVNEWNKNFVKRTYENQHGIIRVKYVGFCFCVFVYFVLYVICIVLSANHMH